MRLKWLLALSIMQILLINIDSLVQQRIVCKTGNIYSIIRLNMAEGRKKSRIKKGKVGNSNVRSDSEATAVSEVASPTSMDNIPFSVDIEKDISNNIRQEISKLPPLQGTAGAKQLEASKKSYIDELFEPTPAGKEPKLVSLLKSITWGAVLILVLIEIFVSLKVGGAPFDLGKVSLPTLPSLPWLNAN